MIILFTLTQNEHQTIWTYLASFKIPFWRKTRRDFAYSLCMCLCMCNIQMNNEAPTCDLNVRKWNRTLYRLLNCILRHLQQYFSNITEFLCKLPYFHLSWQNADTSGSNSLTCSFFGAKYEDILILFRSILKNVQQATFENIVEKRNLFLLHYFFIYRDFSYFC